MIAKKIAKSYGEKAVLRCVDLVITPGVTCLMGPSGSGKTTLLRILLGLERPDAGELLDMPSRFSVMFQEDRLVSCLTVRANLKAALGGSYSADRAERCLAALGLPHIQGKAVSSLSGGMKRRTALARALLFDAPVLLLDEPFGGLDNDSRCLAANAVKEEAGRRPVLLVTHDEKDAALLNGRIVMLEDLEEKNA